MEKRKYTIPQEAFELMNRWTQIKTSYETEFRGKDITDVVIQFEGEQPRFAHIHYKIDGLTGTESIDLSKNHLLDKPEERPYIPFETTLSRK